MGRHLPGSLEVCCCGGSELAIPEKSFARIPVMVMCQAILKSLLQGVLEQDFLRSYIPAILMFADPRCLERILKGFRRVCFFWLAFARLLNIFLKGAPMGVSDMGDERNGNERNGNGQNGNERNGIERYGIEIERKLNELLTEGDMKPDSRRRGARHRISPRYEIRIQTERDPIVEETLLYRQMAKEVDDRYDRYMERVKRSQFLTEEAETGDVRGSDGRAEDVQESDIRTDNVRSEDSQTDHARIDAAQSDHVLRDDSRINDDLTKGKPDN